MERVMPLLAIRAILVASRVIESVKAAIPHAAFKYMAVRYDPVVRKHYYLFEGQPIYVLSRNCFQKEAGVRWLAENIYFAKYRPRSGDTVVDLGAGYGEEAIYLSHRRPDVRYIRIELQPEIVECLSMTFSKLEPPSYVASQCVLSQHGGEQLRLAPHYVKSGLAQKEQVLFPTLTWSDFSRLYHIDRIDLLKINIDGSELQLLRDIGDLCAIRNVVVSCRDCPGRPETTTKRAVAQLLSDQGFQIQAFHHGSRSADDWLFASRADCHSNV